MKAIIFDFNGTMVFDAPYHDLAWKHFAKKLRGYEMNEEELKEHVHGNVNVTIINYLMPGISASENKLLSFEKEKMYRALCFQDKEHYHLVKGLQNFLTRNKTKGIPMTIASASIKENIQFFCDYFELDTWMDVATIKYDDGSYQNKEQMFLDAAQSIHTDISECVIFEDSLNGIACAKRIGAGKIIAISNHSFTNFENDKEIAFVIKDFDDKRLEDLCND